MSFRVISEEERNARLDLARDGVSVIEAAKRLGMKTHALHMWNLRNGGPFNTRKQRRGLTPDDAKAAISQHHTATATAKALGCARGTLRRHLKRAGVVLRQGRASVLSLLTEAERADVTLLRRKAGYTVAQALVAVGRADLVQEAAE